MKFSLQKLKAVGSEPLQFDGQVDIDEIEELNNDVRRIEPVHVKGHASMQGNEVIFQFVVKGTMILPCARTLADVEYPFHVDAVEVFSTSPYYQEEDESEVHPVHGEILDLTPYIKENVLLEVPFRVFSEDQEVQQNALTEGEGWELVSEEKKDDKIDPRLEKLQSLFEGKNEGESQ